MGVFVLFAQRTVLPRCGFCCFCRCEALRGFGGDGGGTGGMSVCVGRGRRQSQCVSPLYVASSLCEVCASHCIPGGGEVGAALSVRLTTLSPAPLSQGEKIKGLPRSLKKPCGGKSQFPFRRLLQSQFAAESVSSSATAPNRIPLPAPSSLPRDVSLQQLCWWRASVLL